MEHFEHFSSEIRLVQTDARSKIPSKAHTGDAGWDLYAMDTLILRAHEVALFDTGWKIALPTNKVGLICPRSGMMKKFGITVGNAPGIIDAGYRGMLGVLLLNTNEYKAIEITAGDRIAQLVITDIPTTHIAVVDDFEETDRGQGGFGSTGD